MPNQAGKLSAGDLVEALGLATRDEAYRWLANRGIPVNYTPADLEQDRSNLAQLLDAKKDAR